MTNVPAGQHVFVGYLYGELPMCFDAPLFCCVSSRGSQGSVPFLLCLMKFRGLLRLFHMYLLYFKKSKTQRKPKMPFNSVPCFLSRIKCVKDCPNLLPNLFLKRLPQNSLYYLNVLSYSLLLYLFNFISSHKLLASKPISSC